jgi:long-chain acyl-CoA synthetase
MDPIRVQFDVPRGLPTLSSDPLLKAFDRLALRAAQCPLVVSPTRQATIGDVDNLARAFGASTSTPLAGPGTTTALVAANGPGFLSLLVALRRAGSAVLLLDAAWTEREIAQSAARFHVSAIARCKTVWPDTPSDLSYETRASDSPDSLAEDAGWIKLTSGSTGEPVGVATPGEALLADDEALTASMGISPEDRLLATLPFSHSYGLSSLVVPALVRGSVLVVPDRTGPFAPLDAARSAGATVFPTVPPYLQGLLRATGDRLDLGGLRRIISAGGRLPPETAKRFRERSDRAVHVFYGSTETGGITYDRSGTAAERETVGEPIAGVRIELERAPAPYPPDAGRVVVASRAVARRYLPQADDRLQLGRFVSDDIGSWRDGELVLEGRLNQLVNVRGKKVDPLEVEKIIVEHDRVDEVAVVGVPQDDFGDELVCAVVACRPGSLTKSDVVNWCRGRLSDFKLPRSVVLVDRIPRTARGKLDRERLRTLGSRRNSEGPVHG